MATEFMEALPHWCKGFDRTTIPPHVTLPAGHGITVYLYQGAGMRLINDNPALVQVGHSPRYNPWQVSQAMYRPVPLLGLCAGETTIRAIDDRGDTAATLEVAVLQRQVVKVAFNFVSDTAKPQAHHTRRKHGEVDKMLVVMNDIYYHHTAIEFAKHSVRNVTVEGDLGRWVLAEEHSLSESIRRERLGIKDEVDKVTAKGDKSADWNVFFVWSVVAPEKGKKKQKDTEGINRGRNCLLEDVVSEDPGKVLAHEAGHYLGIRDHATEKSWLMYPTTDGGRRIPWQHAWVMRRTKPTKPASCEPPRSFP